MELKNFLTELRDDGIVIFTINRPEARNALNTECWEEIREIVNQINTNNEIKLAIFTGSGEKAFISGADIRSLKERTLIPALNSAAQKALKELAGCEKATIAAVNGVAFGGGCELAIACDLRIAVDHAKFGLPELGLGILPAAGGTQRLSRLVGLGRAKEMILTGRAVPASEALQAGLVTQVVPQSELMETAIETATRILSKGPLAVRLAKKAVNSSLSVSEESGMLIEMLAYAILIESGDKKEGVEAFLEKRPPNFLGE
jgi:enoyl-CoA hydratase